MPALIDAVSTTAFDRGYTVIIGSVQERTDLQAAYLHMLMERRVIGAILTSGLIGSAPDIRPLMDRGLRVVLANREIDGLETDAVVFDNIEAARLATSHLLGHSRRRIAFIGGRPDAATTRDRLAGYRSALREAGIEPQAHLEESGSYTTAFGYEHALRLLGGPDRPDGIVAADDTVAVGCLDAITDLGLTAGDRRVRRGLRRPADRVGPIGGAHHDRGERSPNGRGRRSDPDRSSRRPPAGRVDPLRPAAPPHRPWVVRLTRGRHPRVQDA